jgi:predicted RNase H-related nuclease YkuK (DUF458 family)
LETEGILVYCIAEKFDESLGEIAGMDGVHHLYAVSENGLFAIASYVGLDEYGEESMAEKGEDIDWLKEKAQIFMDIILKINNTTGIIPMKFLTIFTTVERVRAIIDDNLEQFKKNFEKIKNREELSVKVYCDSSQYKEKNMGEAISAFEKTLVGKPKGAAFFLKKKFETELGDKIQDKICSTANGFAEGLAKYAADMKSNNVLAKEITGIRIPMILNCAFLVDASDEDGFFDAVEKLRREYADSGFDIELSGPWPPYSFCE